MKWLRILFLVPILAQAQNNSKKIKVLFLGNSYTYVNNLPQMIADIAGSCGDTLVFDSNCIGGYTFGNHYTDQVSKNKIALGNWNYVVLQAQSQEPSFPPAQVNAQTLPYALKLDSLVKAANPCAQTVFYETWGRKFGDAGNCANYPPLCTYTGMQNRLKTSYLMFGDTCKALVAPVGEAWRASITASANLELYQGDQSHPVTEGTYLAAAVFYEMLFGKSVLSAGYTASLTAPVVNHLLNMAHTTVQDSLPLWNIGKYAPQAGFVGVLSGNTFQYAANHPNFSHLFNFGDGSTSSQTQGTHVYSSGGQYTVTHTASNTCHSSYTSSVVTVSLANGSAEQTLEDIRIISPFDTYLELKAGNTSEFVIRIVDLQGRELYTGQNATQINTTSWQKGIYMVELKRGPETQRFRVLKYAD